MYKDRCTFGLLLQQCNMSTGMESKYEGVSEDIDTQTTATTVSVGTQTENPGAVHGPGGLDEVDGIVADVVTLADAITDKNPDGSVAGINPRRVVALMLGLSVLGVFVSLGTLMQTYLGFDGEVADVVGAVQKALESTNSSINT